MSKLSKEYLQHHYIDLGKNRYQISAETGASPSQIGSMLQYYGIKRYSVKRHGLSTHPLNTIWCGMKERCNNPNADNYKWYGGNGISVCDEWNEFKQFYDWAMRNGWRDGLSIDRIDNSKGYSPDNCRWANMTTQSNNRRNTVRLTFEGENHSLAEWSRITGITLQCLQGRVKANWPIEDILCKDNFRHKKRDERHFH